MGKLIQFPKRTINIVEYGKMLWDAIFAKEPKSMFCPDCGHKLQWIPIEPENYQFSKPPEYWGCMKCGLNTITFNDKLERIYWYKQET